MRGFFAFPVEKEFSGELNQLIAGVSPSGFLLPLFAAEYHVTLKYLSNFSSTEFFHCLKEVLPLGAPPRDGLRAGVIALWPTVLVLEGRANEELLDWQSRVNELLERKGFIKNRHPIFKPHITLARLKSPASGRALSASIAQIAGALEGRNIPLGPPTLWRSEAEETGIRHRAFMSVLFGDLGLC